MILTTKDLIIIIYQRCTYVMNATRTKYFKFYIRNDYIISQQNV